MGGMRHGTYAEVRGQPAGTGSLSPPRVSWGSTQAVSLGNGHLQPSEPFLLLWPEIFIKLESANRSSEILLAGEGVVGDQTRACMLLGMCLTTEFHP